MTPRALVPIVILVLAAAGCDQAPPEGAPPSAPGEPAAEPAAREAAPAPVAEPAPAPEEPRPSRSALARQVKGFLDTWSQREHAFLGEWKKGFEAALGRLTWFKKLSTRTYEERGWSLVFSDGQNLAPAAHVLLEALAEVESHGLDPAPYERDALPPLLEAVDARRKAYLAELPPPDDARAAALWRVLDDLRGALALDVRAIELKLAEAGLDDDDLPLVEAAEARLSRIFKAKEALNEALRDLDTALLVRLYRYAYDLRFARRAHPWFAYASDSEGVTRKADALHDVVQALDFEKLAEGLRSLEPRIPEYRAMMDGLAFYRQLAAEHEQPELPASAERLKRGSRGDTVRLLQERLAQEGYYAGELDGAYGESVEAAVALYQETHQFDPTGRMDRSTRASVNKSYAERADQVALALQRHRESDLHQGDIRFGDAPVQIRINIPAFQATFFREGVPARVHDVVVGNNVRETHQATGLQGYSNRTRMFSAEMQTIVLNPTWKVPQRIKEQELDMELLEHPDFYERNNYRVTVRDDGTEEVVQLPGPDNALGLVKFLFPNRFSIYMHDTPKKNLFKRDIRAFSHGCMRTRNALDLARWILVDLQGLPEERFQEILDSREEYGIAVKPKIPLTIDYNTVGVHESGRMVFYADIYRYDRDYLAGNTPYPMPAHPDLYQTVLVGK